MPKPRPSTSSAEPLDPDVRLVIGLQPAREAIRVHGERLLTVFVDAAGGPKMDALARFARDRGATVESRSKRALDRMTNGGRHQGVVIHAPALALSPLSALMADDHAVVVALDGVMDPQNFGAVLRSAVALGATGVLWPEHSSAPLSPATFRASAGAVEHARLCRVPALPDALNQLRDAGVRSIGLDASAPAELSELDLRGPVAVVVGSEDRGLRPAVRKACSELARLPMSGAVASLNASVAGALALYEVGRQRRSVEPR